MNEQPAVEVGPVVKVARDLSEIVFLHRQLQRQAITQGDNPEILGGSAMVALGRVANMEAWENLQQATERYGRAYTSAEDEDPDEAWSAFQLLEFWSEQWRAEHAAEYDQRPTVESEANFLRWSLNWAWENEPHWEDFARDINQARQRLENVLYAGRRAERTRVPCNRDDCERKPALIKLYGERAIDDRYKCTACKHVYDEDAYQRAYADQLRSEGSNKFLPLRDAVATLRSAGRPERTIRKWLLPDEDDPESVVLAYCEVRTRRVLAWWPDLWRRHLETQTRKRSA